MNTSRGMTGDPSRASFCLTARAVASIGDTMSARCGASSGRTFSTYCTTTGTVWRSENPASPAPAARENVWHIRRKPGPRRMPPRPSRKPAACARPATRRKVEEHDGKEGARSAYAGVGSARISRTSDRELTTRLAPWEQTFTQYPQEMQKSSMISACPARTWRALVGQTGHTSSTSCRSLRPCRRIPWLRPWAHLPQGAGPPLLYLCTVLAAYPVCRSSCALCDPGFSEKSL